MLKELIFKYQRWKNDKKVYNFKKSFFGYPLYKENDYYQIYRHPIKRKKIIAAYDKTIVIERKNCLIIIPNIVNRFFFIKIKLTEKFFPGLLQNSKIDKVLIIPYIRATANNNFCNSKRIVVITDKGQIFHNFPMKINGKKNQVESDICLFEESCIWDLPSARYPSKSEDCDSMERYFPGLPDECYEYHPKITEKTPKSFVYYENEKKIVLPRFYVHSRIANSNPFHFIGSGILDHKMTLIGTYRTNTDSGVRTCLFATDDGGENWFCKYEFADFGDYEFRQGNVDNWGLNFGNHIKNFSYDISYQENTIKLYKRTIVLDKTDEIFKWNEIGVIKSFLNRENITIEFSNKHNLLNGNIVALKEISNNKHLNWMINNEFNSLSIGNGMLFKVIVINDYVIELAEFVSQSNHNISCRHVHHINRIKDGWLVGTGEIYPNGWVLFVQLKEADTYSIKNAYSSLKVYRLNTTKNSVQRTMGTIIDGNSNPNLIFASDHDTLDMNTPNSESIFTRNSTGIFAGKLSEIEDRTKFKCIYDAKEPCFYFQKINGKIVFCGQRGEFSLSLDNGKTWIEERLDECFYYYYGFAFDFHIFDNYVIRFKK